MAKTKTHIYDHGLAACARRAYRTRDLAEWVLLDEEQQCKHCGSKKASAIYNELQRQLREREHEHEQALYRQDAKP